MALDANHSPGQGGHVSDHNAIDTALGQRLIAVDHGSTAGTARPTSTLPVKWFGTVAPTNGITNDEWYDRTNEILKRYDGTTWQAVGKSTYATTTALTDASRVVAHSTSRSTVSNNTTAEEPLVSFALPADALPGDIYDLTAPVNLGHTLTTNANFILRLRVGPNSSMPTPTLSLPPSTNPYRGVLRATVYVNDDGSGIMELTLVAGDALATALNGAVISLAGVALIDSVTAGTIVSFTARVFTAFGYVQTLRASLVRRARASTVTHLFNQAALTRGTAGVLSSPNHEWNAKTIAPGVDRFEVRSGDYQQVDGALKERVEFGSSLLLDFDTDYWLSYALHIESGSTSTAAYCVLGQMHGTADAGDLQDLSPPVEFTLEGANLLCKTRSDAAATSTVYPTPVTRYTLTGITRGVPHYFVHKMRFSRTGNGYLQSWVDGVQVHDAAIPLGYNDTSGVYWKHGIYRAASPETIAVRWANVEGPQSASLLARVAAPLPIAA